MSPDRHLHLFNDPFDLGRRRFLELLGLGTLVLSGCSPDLRTGLQSRERTTNTDTITLNNLAKHLPESYNDSLEPIADAFRQELKLYGMANNQLLAIMAEAWGHGGYIIDIDNQPKLNPFTLHQPLPPNCNIRGLPGKAITIGVVGNQSSRSLYLTPIEPLPPGYGWGLASLPNGSPVQADNFLHLVTVANGTNQSYHIETVVRPPWGIKRLNQLPIVKQIKQEGWPMLGDNGRIAISGAPILIDQKYPLQSFNLPQQLSTSITADSIYEWMHNIPEWVRQHPAETAGIVGGGLLLSIVGLGGLEALAGSARIIGGGIINIAGLAGETAVNIGKIGVVATFGAGKILIRVGEKFIPLTIAGAEWIAPYIRQAVSLSWQIGKLYGKSIHKGIMGTPTIGKVFLIGLLIGDTAVTIIMPHVSDKVKQTIDHLGQKINGAELWQIQDASGQSHAYMFKLPNGN